MRNCETTRIIKLIKPIIHKFRYSHFYLLATPLSRKIWKFLKIYKNTLNFAKKSIQIYQNSILEGLKANWRPSGESQKVDISRQADKEGQEAKRSWTKNAAGDVY